MEFTVKTEQFKSMVAKAAKGASQDKILPITSMIAIDLKKGKLILTTTDTSNTLQVIATGIDGDDFYVVIPVDKFSKLISKTNSEKITLSIKESHVEIKGNGVYKIAIPMDEAGPVIFPQFKFKKSEKQKGEINLTSVQAILSTNKSSMSKNIETPYLCGYYVGNNVITTDENVICFNTMKLVDNPVLVPPQIVELLALSNQEKINYWYNGSEFLFETPELVLYGSELEGKENFPVEEIAGYLDVTFPSTCKVPKDLLLNIIDRLSLFIEPYDKNGAYLTFTNEGINIYSKQSSSFESVTYITSEEFKPFVCCVDIPVFKAQIESTPGETVQLWYGDDAAMKITSGNIVRVLALLEDDSLQSDGN